MDERYGRKVQGIKKTQQKIFKNIIIQNETKLSEEGKKKVTPGRGVHPV